MSVLGNVDTRREESTLRELLGTAFVRSPEPIDLERKIRDQWDIFCFSGHSEIKDNLVEIEINPTSSIQISNIKEALKQSGIKIAIFNSCDNFQIAFELKNACVSIPYMILMSKKIHNDVAQDFFTAFIEAYNSGRSFYQAVRIARDAIKVLENRYPCASWLPIIVQADSTKFAPNWQELSRYISKNDDLVLDFAAVY